MNSATDELRINAIRFLALDAVQQARISIEAGATLGWSKYVADAAAGLLVEA